MESSSAARGIPARPQPQPSPSPDAVQLAFERMARAPFTPARLSRFVPLLAIVLLAAYERGARVSCSSTKTALQRDALHRDIDTLAQSMSLRLQAISEATNALARDAASADRDEPPVSGGGARSDGGQARGRARCLCRPGRPRTWSAASPGPLGEAVRNSQYATDVGTTRGCDSTMHASALRVLLATLRGRVRFGRSGQRRSVHRSGRTDLREDRYLGAVLTRISLPELLRRPWRPMSRSATGSRLVDDPARCWPQRPRARRRPTPWSTTCRSTSCPTAVVAAGLGRSRTLAACSAMPGVDRRRPDARRHGDADRPDGARDAHRPKVERALRAETAFRRAMEDSLATGLAVFDRNGVMRHVNAAFCQMTGWSEAELVGSGAPYPVLAAGQIAEHRTTLKAMLAGASARQRLRTQGAAARRHDCSMRGSTCRRCCRTTANSSAG